MMKNNNLRIFEKKNKLGLSTIVVTLIIILMSIVAIAILWNMVKYFIERQAELTEIENQFFSERVNIVSVRPGAPFLNITLRRFAGEIRVLRTNVTMNITLPLEADIFSVVDLSGSMRQCSGITHAQCDDLGGNYAPPCDSLPMSAQGGCISYGGMWIDKLTATQDANKNLISSILPLGNTRIGLVGYRDSVVVPSSINLTDVASSLDTTINTWQAMRTTCICCGINNAALRLSQQSSQEKLKSIIVMSDGEANQACNTMNAKQDAITSACNANSSLNNLVIYSIGVQGADEATLTSIANCGGGKYFSVTNTSDLIAVYQGIVNQIEGVYESITASNYFAILFYNTTDVYRENLFEMPGMLQTKTYVFNLQGQLSGNLTKIEIYPIIITSFKKEVIGPMVDFWEAK